MPRSSAPLRWRTTSLLPPQPQQEPEAQEVEPAAEESEEVAEVEAEEESSQVIPVAATIEQGSAPRLVQPAVNRPLTQLAPAKKLIFKQAVVTTAMQPEMVIPPGSPKPFRDQIVLTPPDLRFDCDLDRRKLTPITALTNKIAPEPGDFPQECSLGDEIYSPRSFCQTTYTWKASNLCHKPLYFEQPRLERYGHSLPPYIQPVASAAHFFVSVPLMPYNMGLELPTECIYTLGYYRPSSCAPYHIPGVPLSVRGAFFEAGLIGALFLVH